MQIATMHPTRGRQLRQSMGKARVGKMLTRVASLAIKEIRCINVLNMRKLTLHGGMEEEDMRVEAST
jgi:hypothetical protein